MTTSDFIKECKLIHNDRYDYSLTEYKNKKSKVKIICKTHGVFDQSPSKHILKQGCPSCAGTKKLTTNEFIEKSKKVHGSRYDYSKVSYKNSSTKVIIICKKHGEFLQTPNNHLNGQNCRKCVNKNYNLTTEDFISKSIEKFGKFYDYSKVNYKSNKDKVILICPKHGEFEQIPNNHFNYKIPCKKCDSENRILNTEDLIKRLNKIHNNYYDYSKLVYKKMKDKSIIICPKHGEFKQRIHTHILGSGCKKCKLSNGEKKISKILKENNLDYEVEYKFSDCKYKNNLRFDFYVKSKNICIEYNGKQHYEPIDFFGGIESLEKTKKRDKIKEKYCKENNILLIKIKYDENIKEKLKKYI